MPDKTGLQFTAKVGTLPEDTFAVVDFTLDFTLDEALNQRFIPDLNLASARPDIDFAKVLKTAGGGRSTARTTAASITAPVCGTIMTITPNSI